MVLAKIPFFLSLSFYLGNGHNILHHRVVKIQNGMVCTVLTEPSPTLCNPSEYLSCFYQYYDLMTSTSKKKKNLCSSSPLVGWGSAAALILILEAEKLRPWEVMWLASIIEPEALWLQALLCQSSCFSDLVNLHKIRFKEGISVWKSLRTTRPAAWHIREHLRNAPL